MITNGVVQDATEVLNDNCGHYTFRVPQDIAPGDYLIRAEVIGQFSILLTAN